MVVAGFQPVSHTGWKPATTPRRARMATTQTDDRRALVDLLPQFLMRALRGWTGMTPVLESVELDRPSSFLLRALVEERDAGEGITEAEMGADLFNPYSTIRPIVDALPMFV